jgi:hypothetical protein
MVWKSGSAKHTMGTASVVWCTTSVTGVPCRGLDICALSISSSFAYILLISLVMCKNGLNHVSIEVGHFEFLIARPKNWQRHFLLDRSEFRRGLVYDNYFFFLLSLLLTLDNLSRVVLISKSYIRNKMPSTTISTMVTSEHTPVSKAADTQYITSEAYTNPTSSRPLWPPPT